MRQGLISTPNLAAVALLRRRCGPNSQPAPPLQGAYRLRLPYRPSRRLRRWCSRLWKSPYVSSSTFLRTARRVATSKSSMALARNWRTITIRSRAVSNGFRSDVSQVVRRFDISDPIRQPQPNSSRSIWIRNSAWRVWNSEPGQSARMSKDFRLRTWKSGFPTPYLFNSGPMAVEHDLPRAYLG